MWELGTADPDETCLPVWDVWAQDADGLAKRLALADEAAGRRSYKDWIRLASEGPVALLHRISKDAPTWQPPAGKRTNGLVTPAAGAELELVAWKKVWRVDDLSLQGAPRPWMEAPIETLAEADMSKITAEGRFEVCGYFKWPTG